MLSLPSSVMLIGAVLGGVGGVGAGPDADAEVHDAEVLVGPSYADSIPARERKQIDEIFTGAVVEACEPPPCTRDCPPGATAVGVEVGGDSRNYTLRWVATDPRLDAPLIRDSSCELCGLAEVEDQFSADLEALCTRLSALDGAPGRIKITSDPDGARVYIDGQVRGRTPWVGELPAGEHQLTLRARQHQSQERTLVVASGVESSEHLELLPGPESALRPVWPAWLGVGAGLVLGVVGATLIAIHDKEWRGRCSGVNIDANGHCRYVYATRPAGIGLAAVGAGALVAGAGLMVWAEREGGRLSSFGVAIQGRF